jgi:hypothetical protein
MKMKTGGHKLMHTDMFGNTFECYVLDEDKCHECCVCFLGGEPPCSFSKIKEPKIIEIENFVQKEMYYIGKDEFEKMLNRFIKSNKEVNNNV